MRKVADACEENRPCANQPQLLSLISLQDGHLGEEKEPEPEEPEEHEEHEDDDGEDRTWRASACKPVESNS